MSQILQDSPPAAPPAAPLPTALTTVSVVTAVTTATAADTAPFRLGPGRFPGIRKPFRSLFWILHVTFGTVCLILVLAVLAALPGLNLLTLGYLLDAQRRVAVSGRLRDGFPLLRLAPRLGIICFFGLLYLIPVRILATQVSASLIVRSGTAVSSDGLLLGLRLMQVLVTLHLLLAIARGGSVGCFLRPLRNVLWLLRLCAGRWSDTLDIWARDVPETLQPARHWLLGFRAVAGAVCWLIIPTVLLVAFSAPGRVSGGFGLLSFMGGLLMIPVAAWLPLLQVHQSVTGRFRDIFRVSTARRIIRQAPLAWLLTTALLYVMTLPLYLTKVRLLPADAFLVLTPFFIVLIYPARVLIAWAYHRGMARPRPAWWGLRWSARLLMLPLLAAYALFLFLTPTISELGKAAPLENHAFLSPIPYAQWSRADR